MIHEPGIFYDMPSTVYFADPCPEPSLTQSVAKILLERSPLHACYAHPKLNPNFEPDDDTKFDIGNVAHKLLIGRGKELVVLPFDDWRTKAAKEAREAAAKIGKLAVLNKHVDRASAMVLEAQQAVGLVGCTEAFNRGAGEVVIAWREAAGFWCRSMIDWVAETSPGTFAGAGVPRTIYDYKTTGLSAAPHVVGRMMADMGWDIQAAMIERGWRALHQNESPRFRFVVQEDEPPFAVTVCELTESVLTMGRKKLAVAMRLWGGCMAQGRWPGYATRIVYPDYPQWAESSWLDREQTEFADDKPRGADLIMAG